MDEEEFNDGIESAKRFLKLAQVGRHPAASGGEQRCYRLAKQLKKSLDDLSGVDGGAVDGLVFLMRAVPGGGYSTVESLLKGIR